MKATFEDVLRQPMQIRVGGKLKLVTATYAMFMAMINKALRGDTKACELVIKMADKLQMLPSIATGATLEGSISSGTVWTEEDESLRPFFEHLKNGPSSSSIYKGGLPDSSSQRKNPEVDQDDRS